MLTSSDQLNSVVTIKANLVKKKAALEAQIKTLGTSQMEEARESISLINESVNLVSSFKSEFVYLFLLSSHISARVK